MGYWATVNEQTGAVETPVDLKEPIMIIQEGSIYVYTSHLPAGCFGARYICHKLVKDIPSMQEKVVAEALDGPDRGMWFCVSPANFVRRYRLAE